MTEIAKRIVKVCPKCGSNNFGVGSSEPVTVSGWYGDKKIGWGSCAHIRMAKVTALRCGDCRHNVSVDPEWDKSSSVRVRSGVYYE